MDAIIMFLLIIGLAVCTLSLVMFAVALYFAGRDQWRKWRDTEWMYK